MAGPKRGITGDNYHLYVDKIIAENEERHKEFSASYNQLTGEGSPVKRFEFKIDSYITIYLPMQMRVRPDIGTIMKFGNLRNFVHNSVEYIDEERETFNKLKEEIQKIRLSYDFEFWAITCCKIQDKRSKQMIPFKLRVAQRMLLGELERMRTAGIPVRVILCKARQWGGSTLVQLWMAWIQLFVKENWHSAIAADVEEQAKNIQGMYDRMATHHPKNILDVKIKPYMRTQKTRIFAGRGCMLSVGSAQRPDSLRSFDFSMLHCSEVGLWKDTKKKTAKDLIQALQATVLNVRDTVIVLESTAKGVGNFFHTEWLKAERGETNYCPVFIPWFKIEEYIASPISGRGKIIDFLGTFKDYHWWLWEQGATLEAIKWYIKTSRDYDDFAMKSEYPTTAEEAFQSTGRRAFPLKYVLNARKNIVSPYYIGEVFGDSAKGKQSLDNLRFEDVDQGCFKVWKKPPNEIRIKQRYACFADIGGKTDRADWSVVRVIDRAPMIAGNKPVMVATWRGHLDQDIFAWKAAQIAKYYHNALLAVESNSLRNKNDKFSEGDHFYTILDEIAPYYDNLYYRTDPQKIAEGAPVDYGFHTNRKTKPMLVDMLSGCMRDEEYIEYDQIACDEADTYEIKEDGSYGAKDGCHDDVVMTTAGALWLCYRYMDLPRKYDPGKGRTPEIVNEFTF